MALPMAANFHLKRQKTIKRRSFRIGGIVFEARGAKYSISRLPNSRVFTILTCILALAFTFLLFPWLNLGLRRSIESYEAISQAKEYGLDQANLDMLPLIFHDLANEGLLRAGKQVAILSNGREEPIDISAVPGNIEMDHIAITDLERQSSIPDETFDFAFTIDFLSAMEFIDRTLKVGGIAAILLGQGPAVQLDMPTNYKTVYFRKFESPILAIKKTDQQGKSATKRRLCSFAPEKKKAALQNLEDVLLEPPRAASGRSRAYLKKTRYLPDLMGDSLESYPRRVFIDVRQSDKNDRSSTTWFARNYPTRNLDFQMYKIEAVTEESSGKEQGGAHGGMSDWLRKNVKEEEYVVMKAEAEVVEEMVINRAIGLVDELFLECKPKDAKMTGSRSRRAYWECLALYGRLRDEGVAVHQWWG